MKAATETLLNQQARFFVLLAILFSVGFHGLLVILFFAVKMHTLAIPFTQEKLPMPFILKRVDMSPSYLQNAQGPSPSAITAQNNQPAVNPSTQQAVGAEVFNKASSAMQPHVDVAPAGVNASTPIVPEAPSTPLAGSDTAAIQAEVHRFETGPSQTTPGNSGGKDSLTAAALAQAGEGTPSGEGSIPGSGGGAIKAPSFQEIAPHLKVPDAGLNPKLPEPIILRLPSDVVFDFDSSHLRPEAFPLLGLAADWIAKYSVARIQVAGHTDTFGNDTYNQKLSENRAKEVEEWLQQKLGSNKYTFEAKGYGKTHPIVNPKGTIKEQEPNRRVEIMIQAINP